MSAQLSHDPWSNDPDRTTRHWAPTVLEQSRGTAHPVDGVMHHPTRDDLPPIIAHRYWCPSCDAPAGQPCRLSGRFPQEYSHEARHQSARRAMWQQVQREIAAGVGAISSISSGWTIGHGR